MKKFISVISIIFVFCLLSSVFCFSQDFPINFNDISPEVAQKGESEDIELFVNESKILDKEAKRVAVGNPEVADVRVISDKEIMLLGKAAGKTNLIIWDKWGQREVLSLQVLASDPQRLVNYLNEIIKAAGIAKVKAIAKGEKIILAGSVSDPAEMEQVNNLAAKIEGIINLVRIVPPPQKKSELIQIDVEVLEISKSALKEMGVAWSETFRFGEIADLTPKEDWLNTFSQLTPGLVRIGRWQHSAVAAKLSLLFEEGKARLLAHPKLVTNSGKQANFRAGGEIPIQVSGENPHIEWKPYGVFLEIEPTVAFKDSINTKLRSEVSSLDWAYATKSGGNTPAVKTRNAQTEVNIKQGDTLLIAGLIQSEQAKNLQKFPLLGDIPILGELFKSTRFQNDQSELVIFVTPTIISVEERKRKIEKEERKAEEEKETEEMLTLRDKMKERLSALRQGEEKARQAEEEARKKREELLALMRRIEELGKENERQARAIRESLSAKRTKQEENLEKINRRIREKLEKKIASLKEVMEEAKKDEVAAIQKRKGIQLSIQQLENEIEGEGAARRTPHAARPEIERFKTVPNLGEKERKIEWPTASKRDYARRVQKEISEFIVRPRGTEDLEGTTILKIRLLSDGGLKEAKVVQSSGHSSLDRVALRSVRKASPYPAFPLGVKEKDIWLKLPINFTKKAASREGFARRSLGEGGRVERKKEKLQGARRRLQAKKAAAEEKLRREKRKREIERKRKEAELRRLEEKKKREEERLRKEELRKREKELRELEKKQQEIAFQLEKEKRKRELEKLREELEKEKIERRRQRAEQRERQKREAELKRLEKEKERIEAAKQRAEELKRKREERERQERLAELKRLAERKKELEARKQRIERKRREQEEKRKQRELEKKRKIEKRILAKYIPRLQEQIREAAAYLPEVKSDENIKEATAVLSVCILSNGNVEEIKIKQPSEFSLFDNTLVTALKRGSPYLPFPKGIERKRLSIEIPITYKRAYPIVAEEKIEKEREVSKLLDKIEKRKPDYFNKGKKYYQLGEYELAIKELEKVSPSEPNLLSELLTG
ncbi:MAG: hypothetical protein B5M48_01555 [Candidatus Omnitrophica bacterium 4484_213]|nr:MAG: hypothetical protein B5M48_01555 [Candidatus Omnitrophica bacterium 4484_213]